MQKKSRRKAEMVCVVGEQYCVGNCEKSVHLYFLPLRDRRGNIMNSPYPEPRCPRRPPQLCLVPSTKKQKKQKKQKYTSNSAFFCFFLTKRKVGHSEVAGDPNIRNGGKALPVTVTTTPHRWGPSIGASGVTGAILKHGFHFLLFLWAKKQKNSRQ